MENNEVVAGVVIEQDGKYLLVQEKQPKAYGLWNLPAGHVEPGETIEQAAVKEAKEETGFDVELIKKVGVFQSQASPIPKHAFSARITGGQLNYPADEILDAKWFAYDEIINMKDKLRNSWVLDSITILKESNK